MQPTQIPASIDRRDSRDKPEVKGYDYNHFLAKSDHDYPSTSLLKLIDA